MQIETKQDLSYIADHSECEFGYMAVMNEQGDEIAITNEMIDHFYRRLLADRTISHALSVVSN